MKTYTINTQQDLEQFKDRYGYKVEGKEVEISRESAKSLNLI